MTAKNNERDLNKVYKKLSHHEHILLRPDRHIGSTKPKTADTWIYDLKNGTIAQDKLTWNPALIKMFDEIITNCVDFSKTPEGKHLNKIEVSINRMTSSIIVTDNGGIPVVMHESGEWIPDMLFGSLFAGSNFNDGDEEYDNKYSGGQNGEGASLVNLFSKSFVVKTSDGKKAYTGKWSDNMQNHDAPNIRPTTSKRGFTSIQWTPDYARMGMSKLDVDNYLMILRRTAEISACNPNLEVHFNGERININSFRDFVRLFAVDGDQPAYMETPDWQIGILPSYDGLRFEAYVNSIATHTGGPHIDYVADKIVAKVRTKLQKAIGVKNLTPSTIKGGMKLFINARIDNPRFNSQTKEEMTTQVKDFGTKLDSLEDQFVKKSYQHILKALDKEISEKLALEEAEEVDKNQSQKIDLRKIVKYSGANGKDRQKCILFLAEGDSAAKPINNARVGAVHGLFPLKGKFPNAFKVTKKMLTNNVEFQAIQAILGGFKIGEPITDEKLRYGETWIATDADYDGSHIRGLIIALYYICWPEYIKQGRLKVFNTPIYRVWKGKDMLEFFDQKSFKTWSEANKNYKVQYLKGLGSNPTEHIRRMMMDPEQYTKTITMDSASSTYMELAFGKNSADDRKSFFENVTLYGEYSDE